MNALSTTTENAARVEPRLFNYPQMFGGGVFFLVAAAVANSFNSALALPFVSIAGAHLATIVAVKLLNQHYPEMTKELLLSAINFKERYPNLQAIAFVVAIVTAYVWSLLSCAFGIVAGFYSGLLIKTAYIKDLQTTYKPPVQPLSAQIAHK